MPAGGTARRTPGGWEPPTLAEAALLFPRFEIVSLLGRGGMGAVYRARQPELEREVAIKLLPLEVSVEPEFADRFRREARALARLNHPGIVTVHDFGATTAGQLFFVMEFVAGENLHTLIRNGLTPLRALEIVGEICEALAYAHGRGIVHRDIKPANVLVPAEGRARVADFGLARLGEAAATLGQTQTGLVMGTPDYMAPEQRRGLEVDARADIYALGATCYEALCGEPPRGAFPPASERCGLDPALDAVLTRALASRPESRFQTADEFGRALQPFRSAPAPATSAGPPQRHGWSRRRTVLTSGSAAALLLAAGWAAVPHSRTTAPGSPPPSPAPAPPAAETGAFTNSLGMRFAAVPIVGGPTAGRRVLFSVWETRVRDYADFARANNVPWPKPEFATAPDQPAINVSWLEATAFGTWLTARERAAGVLPAGQRYRLPSDHEWSCAAGIGALEEAAKAPAEKDGALPEYFPWGRAFPPPPRGGNYSKRNAGRAEETAARGDASAAEESLASGPGDGAPLLAAVGSFGANPYGLYDLGGNAWEWCLDPYRPGGREYLLRGASFRTWGRKLRLSSRRYFSLPDHRRDDFGFRIVLAPEES